MGWSEATTARRGVPVVAGVHVVWKITKEEDTCCELVLRKKRGKKMGQA
jgi:hypothetical protein